MIYPYHCNACGYDFEVTKSVKDIDRPEQCDKCLILTDDRRIAMSKLGDLDMKPEWNPAIGKYIKSKSHLREELSSLRDQGHDMIEVGNESPDKIHKHFESERAAKHADTWSEPTEKTLYEWRNG
jgi:putative FmdB family regulatory protein